MRDLWVPGLEGPHEDFVARLHRQIKRFADGHGVSQPVVEIELRDGSRFQLDSVSPEPGYGFVTISPHPDEDTPGELIVPLGAIARIELHAADEPEPRFWLSLRETS